MNAGTKQIATTVVINGREHVQSDALWKGAIVRAKGLFGQGPREATVVDGKKGIIRCLKIHETNGHFGDTGDTYIDEITHVKNPAWKDDARDVDTGKLEWLPFVLTPRHAGQLKKIRAMGW